jgi:hypothetical protein
MKKTLPLLLLLLLTVTPATVQSAEPRCLSTSGHLVVAADNPDVGESYAIYHKAEETQALPCIFDPATADLIIEGYYDLESLAGDYLVVSEGTSQVRTLLVFDLRKGKQLLSADAEYDGFVDGGVAYWERREMATPENCPQFEEYSGYGGSGVIAHETIFSFDSRQSTSTGETRCDYLE